MATLVWPNGTGTLPPTQVSSEYGLRYHPIDKEWRLHGGIDLIRFSTVCSPVDGVVILAAYSGGFGNLVKIRAWGPNAFKPGDEHWLAHNKSFLVSRGATVTAGQPVAVMGTTGASTGVHCHYETRPSGGSPVNPRHYFATAAGGGSVPFPGGGGTTPPPRDPRLDQIMALLPVVLRVSAGGLTGVHVLLDHDHGFVLPATEINAAKHVTAPYLNNGINTVGTKLRTYNPAPAAGEPELRDGAANGEIVAISEQNLTILLNHLGFENPGSIVQYIATTPGADPHFYR